MSPLAAIRAATLDAARVLTRSEDPDYGSIRGRQGRGPAAARRRSDGRYQQLDQDQQRHAGRAVGPVVQSSKFAFKVKRFWSSLPMRNMNDGSDFCPAQTDVLRLPVASAGLRRPKPERPGWNRCCCHRARAVIRPPRACCLHTLRRAVPRAGIRFACCWCCVCQRQRREDRGDASLPCRPFERIAPLLYRFVNHSPNAGQPRPAARILKSAR